MDELDEIELAKRLRTAIDASERVKIASELGTYGTPKVAPYLLDAIWNEEKSNVREVAVHSFAEIMKESAVEELTKMVREHPDENVRFYAIYRLGELESPDVKEGIKLGLSDKDKKVRAIAFKKAVDKEYSDLVDIFLDTSNEENPPSVIRNILIGLALWKIKKAKDIFQHFSTSKNLELRTLAHLGLARIGEKTSRKYLQEEEIDTSIRIRYQGKLYGRREGMLELIKA